MEPETLRPGNRNGVTITRLDPRHDQIVPLRRADANRPPEKDPLAWIDMSKWDSDPVPERKWAIRDRVPLNQAVVFR
jgi:hypothetical protein